ncbi:hypothetical protein DID77_02120 [Candidatus Marinamargulisbacteria bacterium SCGC AG-439-L15]|nr:hypothetical protein DID77_02120 [Candidatus Marinamargulisbacteria bacterium SCGC AG-439-L15]
MDEMKHVLVIPSWYPPYDGGCFFQKRWEIMTSRGWQVGLVYVEQRSIRSFNLKTIGDSLLQVTKATENGITVLRRHGWSFPKLSILNQKLWVFLMMNLVDRYIKEQGMPDFIHVHSAVWGSVVGRKIKDKYNIPYILSEHRGRFTYQTKFAKSLFKRWFDPLLKYGLETVDYVLPLSKVMWPKLNSYVANPDCKHRVVPNSVDLDFFAPSLEENPINPPTFLTVGGLTEVKGVHLLISALSTVIKKYPDISLRVIGDGLQKRYLEALVRKNHLEKTVSFLGKRSHKEIKKEFDSTSFFVLASLAEGHPNVTCEAMAMGVPVLATSVVSDDVVTPETGILVEPDSVEALEKGLIQAIETRDQYDSKKIRRFAEENFSYDVVFKQIEAVYKEVLSSNED